MNFAIIVLFLGGVSASANQTLSKANYESFVDSFHGKVIPSPATSSDISEKQESNENSDLSINSIRETLHQVELAVFGSSGSIKIELKDEVSTEAEFDINLNTIYIGKRLWDNINLEYSESKNELITFVIAHEIAHYLITIHCEEASNKKTLAGNTCSSSIPQSETDPWYMYYEFIEAYSQEHLEIDLIAYVIMKKMGVATDVVYNFLNNSPIPWGASKRITEALQAERLERIRLAKNY